MSTKHGVARKAKADETKTEGKTSKEGVITVGAIAKEFGIDPKKLRSKMRSKHKMSANGGRYEFPVNSDDHKIVLELAESLKS